MVAARGRGGMGADIAKTGVNLCNADRIGLGLRRNHQAGPLLIGGQYVINQ